ncbi:MULTISPECIES: MinD/ParA family ATP-binding protein [Actinomadura]|uniref:MinD/ParA family protein n=1 Tax=Actinomadura yumaensis TaxID=111807 RepID=A0ABW2CM64_9ACTN|nr:MinD/ParA family protein [Actinomadura sp. J1-007]
MLRRLGRGVRKGIGASAAGQTRNLVHITAQLGAPVPSCRRIAVTSIRGGAGKSTIAALIAGVIRAHREDRVVAIDADPGLGSLSLRLGVGGARSLRELATARPRTWDETAAYLAHTPENLWVLPATPQGVVGDELDHEIFRAGAGKLSRYFSASVIDCGAGLVSGLTQSIIAGAHAQVFVVPGTGDGALSARAALEWFARNGYRPLLTRTVIALVTHTPNPDADVDRARQMLGSGGLPVITIPYDRHLAAGIAIAPERLGTPARDAATHIAAEAFVRSLSGGAV